MWLIEQHATIDFETYSEGGYVWHEETQSWSGPPGSKDKGIKAIGSAAYAEHPSTDILTFSYSLPGDNYPKRWQPGQPNPPALFDYIAAGGLVEAHKAMFERLIWHHVARRRYGWPELPAKQIRCSMAKARVNSLPGALGDLTAVLPVTTQKNPDGKRLINKFSVPQKPTKKQPKTRILPSDDPEDAERLYAYCDTDVLAEMEASALIMPMTADELRFWQLDQEINWRGIGIDRESVRNMIAVMEATLERYGAEFAAITGGLGPSQVQATVGWLAAKGCFMESLDADAVDAALAGAWTGDVRRVLELRALVGSASVKKLYAMERATSADNRIRDIIVHHGARTGRPTGELLQPLNLAKAGPDLIYCEACNIPSKWPSATCPWCGVGVALARKYKWPETPKGYAENPVDHIQIAMASRDLDTVEHYFGDAFIAISGCIRGMIQAEPGMDFIASDYSAIEAVVTACLAGEQWRIDAFRRREDIYLVGAAKITGKTYEYYKQFYLDNDKHHHPDRQKIGKVSELGLGFGGWLTAWRKFDSTETFTDEEVKRNILAWRAASPRIVEMWGGQERGRPWESDYRLERFGFEGAFINAVQYPSHVFEYAGIRFYMRGDALIIRLLSGRELTYHTPRLYPSTRDHVGEGVLEITFMTWNNNPSYGAFGWVPMKTYSGKITENIVQATAHDIQRFGILALEAAGYPIVLHVYDEDIAEVPQGFGSLEEFERIMSTMPPWAEGWPIVASGGWRGRRYRKA
jgi:DNA polymerase bacteriophage-type